VTVASVYEVLRCPAEQGSALSHASAASIQRAESVIHPAQKEITEIVACGIAIVLTIAGKVRHILPEHDRRGRVLITRTVGGGSMSLGSQVRDHTAAEYSDPFDGEQP
jgi:hypothetical protein